MQSINTRDYELRYSSLTVPCLYLSLSVIFPLFVFAFILASHVDLTLKAHFRPCLNSKHRRPTRTDELERIDTRLRSTLGTIAVG